MLNNFINSFNEVADGVHQTAVDKGWWDSDKDDELICSTYPQLKDTIKQLRDSRALGLMHSELSEALEALRHGNPSDDKVPEYSGIEAELADVIIRIMDFAKGRNYRVAEALAAKIEYNKKRERMHGGKKF